MNTSHEYYCILTRPTFINANLGSLFESLFALPAFLALVVEERSMVAEHRSICKLLAHCTRLPDFAVVTLNTHRLLVPGWYYDGNIRLHRYTTITIARTISLFTTIIARTTVLIYINDADCSSVLSTIL